MRSRARTIPRAPFPERAAFRTGVTGGQRLRRLVYGPSLRRTLLRAGIVGVTLLLVSRVALVPLRAVGESMRPTYQQGQWLLVNRLAFYFRAPARGDVVAIRVAGGRAALVKRIVGLPGELIRIEGGTIFVDGQALAEPYVRFREPWDVDPVRLSVEEYYVIGDNRGMPSEAHDFGRTSRERLLGPLLY